MDHPGDYLSKLVQLVELKAMLEKWLPVAESAPVDVSVLKALVGEEEKIIREFLHDFRVVAEKIAAELRTNYVTGQYGGGCGGGT
jgi:two-component system, sensor histidine kinase and response regulator